MCDVKDHIPLNLLALNFLGRQSTQQIWVKSEL